MRKISSKTAFDLMGMAAGFGFVFVLIAWDGAQLARFIRYLEKLCWCSIPYLERFASH